MVLLVQASLALCWGWVGAGVLVLGVAWCRTWVGCNPWGFLGECCPLLLLLACCLIDNSSCWSSAAFFLSFSTTQPSNFSSLTLLPPTRTQVYQSKSAEFREAIASLLGLKLAFYPNGQVRVTSIYDLCASFVFQPAKGGSGSAGELALFPSLPFPYYTFLHPCKLG